ncbi:MAG: efflux RND transporter periplasmic adaptor subunit [Gemmatimonadales bacterium]|nr:MAG: efflux RND transporter periplasmic adaptor subunit [Gemmatimonadales bacterium]
MSGTRKILVAVLVVLLLGGAGVLTVVNAGERGAEVRVSEVRERDLVSTITATGNVRARRKVNISSDVMGRVIELNVEEGDEVEAGSVLLRIDPSQTEAAVSRARAQLAQARAQTAQQRASLVQAEREANRIRALRDRGDDLVSTQAVEEAETQVEVQQALLESAEHGVDQAQASLAEVEDQLSRTTIIAPISGRVTRLNIETGETVVVGTTNTPGSLLLTISDLSVVEAVMAVDETDLPRITLGDSATVELDAFPRRTFAARVAKIGNSAIQEQTPGSSQGAVDYEVILTLLDPPEALRPDLSAVADIIVERREGVLSVPIISVTTRPPEDADENDDDEEVEGVFLLSDGTARWQEVELGITGRDYFEIVSGLQVGDSVVSGPFARIRSLSDGDAVRVLDGGSSSGSR